MTWIAKLPPSKTTQISLLLVCLLSVAFSFPLLEKARKKRAEEILLPVWPLYPKTENAW